MYKGEMFSANLEKNRITIEVEGEMKVKAGKLVVLSDDEYTTLQAELEKAKELLREARDWMKEEASIKMRNGANRDVVDSYDDKAYKLTKFLEAKSSKTIKK